MYFHFSQFFSPFLCFLWNPFWNSLSVDSPFLLCIFSSVISLYFHWIMPLNATLNQTSQRLFIASASSLDGCYLSALSAASSELLFYICHSSIPSPKFFFLSSSFLCHVFITLLFGERSPVSERNCEVINLNYSESNSLTWSSCPASLPSSLSSLSP